MIGKHRFWRKLWNLRHNKKVYYNVATSQNWITFPCFFSQVHKQMFHPKNQARTRNCWVFQNCNGCNIVQTTLNLAADLRLSNKRFIFFGQQARVQRRHCKFEDSMSPFFHLRVNEAVFPCFRMSIQAIIVYFFRFLFTIESFCFQNTFSSISPSSL